MKKRASIGRKFNPQIILTEASPPDALRTYTLASGREAVFKVVHVSAEVVWISACAVLANVDGQG